MIAREHRFHGHNSLNYLFRRGRTVRAEFMALRYSHNKRSDFRMAVIVSRKVSKSAVVRNRIRRRLYEIVRLLHKEQGQKWPYDLSITVFDERVAAVNHHELDEAVKHLIKKAGIY